MRDPQGKEIAFDRGLATLELQNWRDFERFVRVNQNLKGYIFRGQRCSSFELVSSLLRLLREKHKTLEPKELGQHLMRFRLAIRGRITLPERELLSASELWSIGQHHGLATPLLDWTASPLVAGFFAFTEAGDDCDKRSVYALYAKRINQLFFAELRENLAQASDNLAGTLEGLQSFAEELPEYGRDDPLGIVAERIAERLLPADLECYSDVIREMDGTELDVPRIIAPLSGENRRLVNQRGLFTKFTGQISLEEWVRRNFVKAGADPYSGDSRILLKVNIPNSERANALTALDAANINHLSLFPDVEGAARFANAKL
jgi:hypothetical protein